MELARRDKSQWMAEADRAGSFTAWLRKGAFGLAALVVAIAATGPVSAGPQEVQRLSYQDWLDLMDTYNRFLVKQDYMTQNGLVTNPLAITEIGFRQIMQQYAEDYARAGSDAMLRAEGGMGAVAPQGQGIMQAGAVSDAYRLGTMPAAGAASGAGEHKGVELPGVSVRSACVPGLEGAGFSVMNTGREPIFLSVDAAKRGSEDGLVLYPLFDVRDGRSPPTKFSAACGMDTLEAGAQATCRINATSAEFSVVKFADGQPVTFGDRNTITCS